MAILKIRDENGKVHEILAIRGEDYILTEQDKEEIASMISDSDGNGNFSALTEHKNDKSNPHEVTAQQIGAVTQEELQEALDSIVIPEGGDSTALNEHIADKNNPHEVTAEQIGAATQDGLDEVYEYVDDNFTHWAFFDDLESRVIELEENDGGVSAEDIEIINDEISILHDHMNDDESNPHKVTCEQIGAVTQDDLDAFKEQVIDDVIAALPVYNGEVV